MLLADLKTACKAQFEHSKQQGFWTIDDRTTSGMMPFDLLMGTKLGLIATEVAEATEEYRKNGHSEHFAEELADIVIRVMDIAGAASIDLGEHIALKIEKNKDRPFRHGKRF